MFERAAAQGLFSELSAATDGARGRPGRRPGGAGAGQHPLRARAGRRRDRVSGRGIPRPEAQSDRRRTDDVRAGQQRALPAQDLQCGVHDRRRAAGAQPVRHDPPHAPGESAAHGRRLFGQRLGHGRRHRGALSRQAGLRLALPGGSHAAARADEGGNAQPSDGDLALSRCVDRRRRRDSRRGRHRPRLAAQGRPDRLHRLAPVGQHGGPAGAYRQSLADHDRGPAGRRGVQQRIRPAQSAGLFPRIRAGDPLSAAGRRGRSAASGAAITSRS